jgi:fibronectin type 3 domain-containing protein
MSAAVRFAFVDQFAPATPAGLSVITGLKTVELSWDRNIEPDLKGYQVYRGEGEAALMKMGAVLDKPAFSDAKIESGKKYRYAVAAVDEGGNESEACAAVEVIAP